MHIYDELNGALIGLAKACSSNAYDESAVKMVVRGLSCQSAMDSSDRKLSGDMAEDVREEKYKIVPNCRYCTSRCGNTDDYDMDNMWQDSIQIRNLKEILLQDIIQMAYDVVMTGEVMAPDDDRSIYLLKSLCMIGYEAAESDLLELLQESEEMKGRISHA